MDLLIVKNASAGGHAYFSSSVTICTTDPWKSGAIQRGYSVTTNYYDTLEEAARNCNGCDSVVWILGD